MVMILWMLTFVGARCWIKIGWSGSTIVWANERQILLLSVPSTLIVPFTLDKEGPALPNALRILILSRHCALRSQEAELHQEACRLLKRRHWSCHSPRIKKTPASPRDSASSTVFSTMRSGMRSTSLSLTKSMFSVTTYWLSCSTDASKPCKMNMTPLALKAKSTRSRRN